MMALKLTDRPKCAENPIRIDPYEEVMKIVLTRNYAEIKSILTGKRTARQIDVFPSVLKHLNPCNYDRLIRNAKKNGYIAELNKCFKLAYRLAQQFGELELSDLEKALEKLSNQPEPTTRMSEFPYESFEHAYETYQYEPRH